MNIWDKEKARLLGSAPGVHVGFGGVD